MSVTNLDDDSATVQFAAASSSVAENSGTLNVVVQLNVSGSGTLGSDVTVQVVDLGTGSATASGVDYTFSTPTLVTFASRQQRRRHPECNDCAHKRRAHRS